MVHESMIAMVDGYTRLNTIQWMSESLKLRRIPSAIVFLIIRSS